MKDVIFIGGGLAGLIGGTLLARKGLKVLVVEKKAYPFHRVCGEYVSNEVVPFLSKEGLYPEELNPSRITQFQLTATGGKAVNMPLDLGGFGLSRYLLDQFLYDKALEAGCEFHLNTQATGIIYNEEGHPTGVKLNNGHVVNGSIIVGAFGKRSVVDRVLERSFIRKRSPYVGVKYHIRSDFPADLIALHNFQGGYCGVSMIEDEKINICYLAERAQLKRTGSIDALEEEVLFENPYLKNLFRNADFLWDKPLTINEISFESKDAVEQGIFMTGDAAGMIAPLCGNGMAIAIHSAKLLAEAISSEWHSGNFNREAMERKYTQAWRKLFGMRLWSGRQIQKLFGDGQMSNFAVNLARSIRPVANILMRKTHGVPF